MGLSEMPKQNLRVYNTLTKKKELFSPQRDNEVSFYVCGVTVYDVCHIGHARAYVVFDTMRRYLEEVGYDVKYVQNFTDIDDKIIVRAEEQGLNYKEIADKYTASYFEDMDRLHIKRATVYPRATHFIKEMIVIIEGLIEKGHAYESDGEVCFSVETFDAYGALSKKVLEDLASGIRVNVSQNKRNPLDFVLWKRAKEGEPSWDSPWGKGRPGWHIECSAMSLSELSETIDIHGGGEDLVFPHHENEIAQSECFTGKPFVKYWLHNGFVTIKNEKMSKSKQNFYSLRDVLSEFSGDVIRFYLLKVHYRSPLHFSFEGLKESAQALSRLTNTVTTHLGNDTGSNNSELKSLESRFFKSLDDDFNFAEAIGVLFDLSKWVNTHKDGVDTLLRLGRVLGLFNTLKTDEEPLDEKIDKLVSIRNEARNSRDFKKADEIRDVLKNEYGIVLEDTKEGVKWKKIS
jgi:cysteinyl-tRNA synthetase